MNEVVTVRTIPVSADPNGMRWLDCSVCGPVGLATLHEAHCAALHHLATHNIEVPPCR